MSDTHNAEDQPDHLQQHIAVETEARDYGWAPKEQFKGPEDKWKPADQYLDWAKQVGRLPKSEFDDLKRQFPAIRQENGELKVQLAEIKDTLKTFSEFSSRAEERAFNRAKQEITQRIEAAATNADPVAARAAMAELEALKPEAVKPPEQKTEPERPVVQPDPVIQDWISKEEWFTRNKTLNAFATDTFGDLERAKPGVSKSELLAETKRLTMEKFPEKFGINPMREGAVAVATPAGGTRQPKRGGKTYDDLPAEAKKACDKFVKQIPGYTRDKYVKDYPWDN